MNDENTRKLFKRFPFLKKENMPDEFECGDGWYKLVYDMCKEVKSTNPPNDFVITRIAEKHGELEVHSKNGAMRTRVAIDEFNTASIEICDDCGHDRNLEKCSKCTVEVIEYPDAEEEDDDDIDSAPVLCKACYVVPCNCPCTTCSASPCACAPSCGGCGSSPCSCAPTCGTCSSTPCICQCPACYSNPCTCGNPCACGIRNCKCP